MSRKHYTMIAEAIKSTDFTLESDRLQIALKLANLFSAESRRDINGNRLFDREKFLTACGV